MPEGDGTARKGADHFAVAWRLAAGAWAGCVLLQTLLYVRPGPYGGAFLIEWDRYFALALYYELLGTWLLAFPFLALWMLSRRRAVTQPVAAAIHALQAALLTANLLLTQFDHELLRFLGVRLGASFLTTYMRAETLSDSLFIDVLLADKGGPFVPLLLLVAVPGLYAWWAGRMIKRRLRGPARSNYRLWAALLIAFLPLAAPANAWFKATGQFRLRKIEPVVLALATDLRLGSSDLRKPRDLRRLAQDYQRRWLAESGGGWRFPDPAYPYLRVPAGTREAAGQGPAWNLIFIQLETFRGMDSGFLNPARPVSATPYLDRLARSAGSATWTRALSFGPPSLNGLFAAHCSITPHSRRFITSFTHAGLYCLPEALRKRGYRSEMFNAGDTDWDNSTLWIRRWYDRLWRYPDAEENDRLVFRAAARRVRELGASGRPFMATLVSVSNHTPFRSQEQAFDIAGQDRMEERILNTTHYTDDVLREFVESIRGEPWFEHTLLVVTGDHGFNMAEHGGRPGDKNLYRESVWVPLVMLGAHPRLPRGTHGQPVSHLDIAPTVADLLGLREPVPWQGHSLASARSSSLGVALHGMLLGETARWSALSDPVTGVPRLYDAGRDWLQRRDLASRHPAVAEALLRRSADGTRLNDYLLRNDKVWPAR